jgi:hypothetical protein
MNSLHSCHLRKRHPKQHLGLTEQEQSVAHSHHHNLPTDLVAKRCYVQKNALARSGPTRAHVTLRLSQQRKQQRNSAKAFDACLELEPVTISPGHNHKDCQVSLSLEVQATIIAKELMSGEGELTLEQQQGL